RRAESPRLVGRHRARRARPHGSWTVAPRRAISIRWSAVAEERTEDEGQTVAEGSAGRRRQAARRELGRGTLLDRYLVIDKLGEGGMGIVYAAYDPDLHRKVAIKILHPEIGEGAPGTAGRARMLREAQ